MVKAIDDGHNQYTRSFGHPALVNKIAEVYGRKFNRQLNPMKEVLASQGANGALNSYIMALVKEGDSLVTFEPMFQMYLDQVELSGGQLQTVPLKFEKDTWRFKESDLRAALDRNAKVLLLNTPHNPTGKVFSREELLQITEVLKDYPQVVVVTDEVYDFLAFDKRDHVHFASLADNWQRTVSIFSGGKLFACTGWKVGWAIGPQYLLHAGAVI